MNKKRLQRESFIIKCTVICECVRIVWALKLNKSFVDTLHYYRTRTQTQTQTQTKQYLIP